MIKNKNQDQLNSYLDNSIECPIYQAHDLKNNRCLLKGYKINVKDYRRNLLLKLRNKTNSQSISSMYGSVIQSTINSKGVTPRNSSQATDYRNQYLSAVNQNKQFYIKKQPQEIIINKKLSRKFSKATEIKRQSGFKGRPITDQRMQQCLEAIKKQKTKQNQGAVQYILKQQLKFMKTQYQDYFRSSDIRYSYEKHSIKQPNRYSVDKYNQRSLNSVSGSLNLNRSNAFNATNYYHQLKINFKKAGKFQKRIIERSTKQTKNNKRIKIKTQISMKKNNQSVNISRESNQKTIKKALKSLKEKQLPNLMRNPKQSYNFTSVQRPQDHLA